MTQSRWSFRPLAGCGLFPRREPYRASQSVVSVPLRGVGCFNQYLENIAKLIGFRPLAGCGLFLHFEGTL